MEIPLPDPGRNFHEARNRFYAHENKPLFHVDWTDLMFHHFEVDSVELQKKVPFELDLYEGKAYVSLVGFHSSKLWLDKCGKWTRYVNAPFATHDFLNLRTYVKHGGEAGIYFLTEFVNRKVSVLLGRMVYGLPYHRGTIHYSHHLGENNWGSVKDCRAGVSLAYESGSPSSGDLCICNTGTLEEFLCEKYTAYTSLNENTLVFRILHEPWKTIPMNVNWKDLSLLKEALPFLKKEGYIGSEITPGLKDVLISRPRSVVR